MDGSGIDTLVLGDNIRPEDVVINRNISHLYIRFNTTDDIVEIKNWFSSGTKIENIEFSDGTIWSKDYLESIITVQDSTEFSDTIGGTAFDDVIDALGGNDTVYGAFGDDTLSGGEGNDNLRGGEGNDSLIGGTGVDMLFGNAGNDLLIGGEGNDSLYGGKGNDTYRFETSFGQDTIYNDDIDGNKFDIIEFGDGISPGSIIVTRNGWNLILEIEDSGEQLKIDNFFDSGGVSTNGINEIHFSDSTVWDASHMVQKVMQTSDGDDKIEGFNTSEIIDGKAGDDHITSGAGDDVLIGGKGNDYLRGGLGNDTYRFEAGFGQDVIYNGETGRSNIDVIEFGEGISAESIEVYRLRYNLVIDILDTDDQITINNYFSSANSVGLYTIREIRFADGTVWDKDRMMFVTHNGSSQDDIIYGYNIAESISGKEGNDLVIGHGGHDVLRGGEGDDELYGNTGNDLLIGGTGDDRLDGGDGNDVYRFESGFGSDIIRNIKYSNTTDIIEFGEGIDADSVLLRHSNNDLILSIGGTDDQITVKDYFIGYEESNRYIVDLIKFSDGTEWGLDTIKEKVLQGDEEANDLRGFTGDDTLVGGGGNDSLKGFAGDDILIGGTGDDELSDNSGDEIYVINRGDGKDHILDTDGSDTLMFGEGISKDDLIFHFVENSNDLFIGIRDPANPDAVFEELTDVVQIGGWYQDSMRVEFIAFTDSSEILTADDVVELFSTDGDDNIKALNEGSTIHGGAGDDVISAIYGDNTFDGGEGNDILNGGLMEDTLSGGSGDDILNGGEGSDVLDGGVGNDILEGGIGNDIYKINLRNGHDIISDTSGVDTISFGAGVTLDDLVFKYDSIDKVYRDLQTYVVDNYWDVIHLIGGDKADTVFQEISETYTGSELVSYFKNHLNVGLNENTPPELLSLLDKVVTQSESSHLYIGIKDPNTGEVNFEDIENTVVINNWFTSTSRIEKFIFEETGETLFADDIILSMSTDGDDFIKGLADGSRIVGGAGDDEIFGDTGDDFIIGGTGDDLLEGGKGDDTYIFNKGDGKDTILDASKEEFEAGYYNLYTKEKVYHHEFWYIPSGNDTIQFKGISQEDLIVKTSNNDLIIGIKEDGVIFDDLQDTLILKDFHISGIEKFEFDSGDVLNTQGIINKLFTEGDDNVVLDTGMSLFGISLPNISYCEGSQHHFYSTETNKYLYMAEDGVLMNSEYIENYNPSHVVNALGGNDTVTTSGGDDTVYAGEGDDTVTTSGGDDIVYGGDGNDHIETESGVDYLEGGSGDDYLSGGSSGDDYSYGISDDQDIFEDNGNGIGIKCEEDGTFIDTRGTKIDGVFNANDDHIVFKEGISLEDIEITWGGELTGYYRNGEYVGEDWVSGAVFENHNHDLVIYIKEDSKDVFTASDRIVITDWFDQSGKIEAFVFSDGTSISTQEIVDLLSTNGDDLLDVAGSNDSHIYNLLDGNDKLLAGNNCDIVNAGSGDDIVDAGDGSNTVNGGDGDDHITTGNDQDVVFGESGDDFIITGLGADILSGGGGNDTLIGDIKVEDTDYDTAFSKADYDNPEDGDYTLQIHDHITGGKGDDVLKGGYGNDVYYFNRGDGTDTITDELAYLEGEDSLDRFGHWQWEEDVKNNLNAGKNDFIQFGEGITTDDIVFFWNYDIDVDGNPVNRDTNIGSNDLIVALRDPNNPDAGPDELSDKIIIRDFYLKINMKTEVDSEMIYEDEINVECGVPVYEYVSKIENFQFTDGSIINGMSLIQAMQTNHDDRIEAIIGEGSTIYGLGGNDVLTGDTGDDQLYGGEGNDRIDGGYGDNVLDGGVGDDTYVISSENNIPGDDRISNDQIIDSEGSDKILFLNDVAREDIVFTKSGDDLIIHYGLELQHSIKIADNTIERFETSDGSFITREEVEYTLTQIASEMGVDVSGVTHDDIFNNLDLKTVQYNTWTDGYVQHEGTDWDDNFTGLTDNEIVNGNEGYDELIGNSGNDILHGNEGNDFMNAGNGNDTYIFGRGDQNDEILDKQERIYVGEDGGGSMEMAMSYGGDEEISAPGDCLWSYMPNEAPSNDTLFLQNGIQLEDISVYWAMEEWGNYTLDNLMLKIRTSDETDDNYSRENNISAILNHYNNPSLTEEDLSQFSDKSLQHFTHILKQGYYSIGNETVTDNILNYLETVEKNPIYYRDYESEGDTITIQGYYDERYNIENIYFEGIDYSLTNNELMDIMTTNGSESIRGVDWADNIIEAEAGNDIVVGGAQSDTISGDEGSDLLHGRSGDDTYNFDLGDGRDMLFEGVASVYNLYNNGIADWKGIEDWSVNDGGLHTSGGDLYITSSDQVQSADTGGYDKVNFGKNIDIQDISFSNIEGGRGLYVGYGDLVDGFNPGIPDETAQQGDASSYNFAHGTEGAYEMGQKIYSNDIFLMDQFVQDRSVEEFTTASGSHITFDEMITGFGAMSQYIDENSDYLEIIQSDGRDARGYVDQYMLNQWHRVDNVLTGTDGAETIFSGDGDDSIFAGGGDDVVEGGFGTDMLEGGSGDDTYIYNRWDGSDTIVDAGGHDKIVFGEDLLLTDFIASVSCDTGDLVLGVIDEVEKLKIEASGGTYFPDPMDLSQKVIIQNFGNEDLRVDQFVFSDGTEMTAVELHEYFLNLQGSDIICGFLMKTEDYNLTLDEDSALSSTVTVENANGNLIFSIENNCVNGDFNINNDGKWNYIPDNNYNGADSVVIKITSQSGIEVFSIIDLTINPINDLPEVVDPDPNILKDIRIAAGAIEATDIDVDVLSYSVSDPEHGILSIDADGNWNYTADDLYMGTDSAIVTIDDGNGGVVTTNLSFDIQVSSPTVGNYNLILDEDTSLSNALSVTNPIGGNLTYEILDSSDFGTFELNNDGTFEYVPTANYNGGDEVSVKVTNEYGLTATSTISLIINPINDLPEVVDPDPNLLKDIRIAAGAIEATDIDVDVLSYSVSDPEHGTLSIDADGNWNYTADDLYMGTDSAIVTIDDGNGGVVTTNLSFDIHVSSPTVGNYNLTLDEDTSLSNALSVTNPIGGNLTYEILDSSDFGTFELNNDGTFEYVPTVNYNGGDEVSVKVTNEYGLTATSTISLTINPINDLPEVVDPDPNILKDIRITAGAIEATDIDVDVLDYSVSDPEHGTLSIDMDGNWNYTADDLYMGNDSAIVTINDGNGGVVTTNLSFDIQVSPPQIDNSGYSLDEDTSMTTNLIVTNLIGGELIYALEDTTDNGTFNITTDGRWEYTPIANYNGADSFEVTVTNEYGLSTTEIIHITINPVNDAPEVVDANPYILLGGVSVGDHVEASDIDGDTLSYSIQNEPENGTIVIDADGNWIYAPTDGFMGTDKVTVLVDDGNGGTVTTELDFKVNVYDGGDIVIDDGPEGIKLEGVGACDIQLKRSCNDLVVTIEDKGTITFIDYFISPGHAVDYLETTEGKLYLGNDMIFDAGGHCCWWSGTRIFGQCNTDNTIYGTDCNDRLYGANQTDVIFGAGGNDRIYGGYGNDTLIGGNGNDRMHGDAGDDTLLGGFGCDTLSGGSGNDALIGGNGNDILCAGKGNDLLCGDDGNDRLYGENGDDKMTGNDGCDLLYGGCGDDLLDGGAHHDNLYGGSGNDILFGGDGHDLLYGDIGNDSLYGGDGQDNLYGNEGDDFLTGNKGNDLLKGGHGSDTYTFNSGDGCDQIKDENRNFHHHWCSPVTDESIDTVIFGETVSVDDVAFYQKCNNLYIQYGDNDMIKIYDQGRNSGQMERFELADGSYLTNSDINLLIQELSAFACDNGIDISNVNDIRNNDELMNIVMNSWKQ